MTTPGQTKILIVVFDALRPEFVRPDLMPNLCRFADQGCRFINSRSTFPTETRVNQTAVLTGCYPRRHGIVGNKFPELSVSSDRVVNTGDNEQISEAFLTAQGGLIQSPTLPDRLAALGLNYAALSAGTPGGGRLINHSAEANRTFRLAMHCPEASQPAGALEASVRAAGPLPAYHRPALDWINWASDAYLGYIVPEVDPDVMLLWLCEPDETFHFLGIGSEPALETIRNADRQFGRILEHHARELDSGALHLIAMSDHGQISLEGEALDLVGQMQEAGFRAGKAPGEDVDYTVVAGNAASIWARERAQAGVVPLVEWIQDQPWCGPVFTRDGLAGTLKLEEVLMDHPRSPDVAFAFRYSDGQNSAGIRGLTQHDAFYPERGGCHGGLSPHELNNVLILGGQQIRAGRVDPSPAGNIDVLPTLFALLGLPEPDGIDGAALSSAFHGRVVEETRPEERMIEAPNGRTRLSVTETRGRRYLNRAWAV
ncbi:MAG: alkaline phosphatase family protein [Pseudomonadota bacterium]